MKRPQGHHECFNSMISPTSTQQNEGILPSFIFETRPNELFIK